MMSITLRPYQLRIAQAISASILKHQGLTFTVEIARQGGKNEISAVLELWELVLHGAWGGSIIKASPTFKPQTIISMDRLKTRLGEYFDPGVYTTEAGYIIHLAEARCVFLSADESANVVGHTADILLEIDEAQDINKEKYTKEFRPMGSSTNCTSVLYGTTWDDTTLLEVTKQANLEMQKKDGVQRHFSYDWTHVAACNPDYANFVEQERLRLGDEHPLFRTQYRLLPITGGGRLLSTVQIALLAGSHDRENSPTPGASYIAGLDLAGQEESVDPHNLQRDSTVLTIARHDKDAARIVSILTWTGTKHTELWAQLVNILTAWHCHHIVVDATGIGEPTAAYLKDKLGSRVIPYKFTQVGKSELGFDLIATINQGNLSLWRADGSAEHRLAMSQMQLARSQYRLNQTLNFFVDEADGHDDVLMSTALCAHALKFKPKIAVGGVQHDRPIPATATK